VCSGPVRRLLHLHWLVPDSEIQRLYEWNYESVRNENKDSNQEPSQKLMVFLSRNSSQLVLLLRSRTYGRLGVVACGIRVDTIAPNVRTKLAESESRIMSDNTFAQLRTGLSRSARTEVQVIDLGADGIRELFALGGLRRLEVRSEVHMATNKSECVANIDQNDLLIKRFDVLSQIYLHVDQND